MANRQAVDVSVHQTLMGTACVTGFSFLHDVSVSLTMANLTAFAAGFITDFIPLLHAVQSDWVYTSKIFCQARGTATPANDYVVNLYAEKVVPTANVMPPEFNYWLRWYTGETQNSLNEDINTANPIKRGGAFITGVSDLYLTDGAFGIPSGDVAAWQAIEDYMVDTHNYGGITWQGCVLGEQIVSGTGWRAALIEDGVCRRVTRLRSRLN